MECLKKNAFKAETQSEGDTHATLPVLEEVKWYLPASGQFPLSDPDNALNGDYWTSTAVRNSNSSSYKYTVGSGVSEESRSSVLNVRAVRVRN